MIMKTETTTEEKKYVIDRKNFCGNVETTMIGNLVRYSGALHNNEGEDLTFEEYVKIEGKEGFEIVDETELMKMSHDYFLTLQKAFVETTEEEFYQCLEELPPLTYHEINKKFVFLMSGEATVSYLHVCFLKDVEERKYYTALRSKFLTDTEILKSFLP